MAESSAAPAAKRGFLDMTGYQWLVILAAWLGWGFDVFDGLLFNYVAPNCVPTLLGIPLGTPEAKAETIKWLAILTSALLIGWAIGGIVFGRIADRIGRTRTLLLTMFLYALGTAACSIAPNIWALMLFRLIASLGIGGEWAAGAAMVAEVVPEKRRVEAGALLYTSAPLGLFLATFVNYLLAGNLLKGSPETSWRWIFLCGLVPAAVALVVRIWVKEPERWKKVGETLHHPRIAELFSKDYRHLTISGLSMAIVALITWWSCNAFMPSAAGWLADDAHKPALKEAWKTLSQSMFNLGGLVGTLLAIPIAKNLGRKKMFLIYYFLAAIAVAGTWGLPLQPEARLYSCFFIGLTVFGVFGSFTFYLPELFPTRIRSTGAGFCYNAGRIVTAGGPLLVWWLVSSGKAGTLIQVLTWVGAVPLLGLLLLPFVIETKEQSLVD